MLVIPGLGKAIYVVCEVLLLGAVLYVLLDQDVQGLLCGYRVEGVLHRLPNYLQAVAVHQVSADCPLLRRYHLP